MAKRIPCRVVSSRPLGKSGEVSISGNFHTRIGDFDTGSLQGKSAGVSVIYTRALDITRMSKYSELGGRLLDCYV